MKKLNELFPIIKTDNKKGNAVLQSFHKQINEILFNNAYSFIYPTLGLSIYSKIKEICIELNLQDLPTDTLSKKKEILFLAKKGLINLKQYGDYFDWDDDVTQEEAQKILNFQTVKWMQLKRNDIQYNDITILYNFLKKQNDIYINFIIPLAEKNTDVLLNTHSFDSVTKECLKKIYSMVKKENYLKND